MKKTKKAKLKMAAPPAPMPRPGARHVAFIVLAVVIGMGGGYALWTATHPASPPAADDKKVEPAVPAKSTEAPATASRDTSQFQKLKGRWRRPDGGYVVDVSSVDELGRVEATYLNPMPIKVSKAEASQDGVTTKMFLELSGQNYAGSTYDLTYDPESDQLTGVYYQAVLGQRFDVTFVRKTED